MSVIITPIILPAPRPKCPTCGQEIREKGEPMGLPARLAMLVLAVVWLAAVAVFRYHGPMADERDPLLAWGFSLIIGLMGGLIVSIVIAFVDWVVRGNE